jgi:hypothetical protein
MVVEDAYSTTPMPFLIVTGPPVVPMQLSSDASVFLSADIGMEGVAGSPWPSPRVYPLVFSAQRSTRSCRPQDLPKFLSDSFSSLLVSIEPFKMFGPVLVGDWEGPAEDFAAEMSSYWHPNVIESDVMERLPVVERE